MSGGNACEEEAVLKTRVWLQLVTALFKGYVTVSYVVLASVDYKCVLIARDLRYQSGGHYDHCIVVCDGVLSGERR